MKLEDQNILYIGRATQQGGAENVILQLCEIFQPLVNKIVVCAGHGFNRDELRRMGIKFYEIPDIENKSIKNIIFISKTLKTIVREENITVIHTHHRMAAFYVSFLRLYKSCFFINTSHNTFYDKVKLTHFAYRHAHLTACGEMVGKNLKDVFRLNDVKVIHNAVKPFDGVIKEDTQLKGLKDKNDFLIGNVGRMTEQKGFRYFIKSIPAIIDRHPNARFIMIGSGELEDKLRILADHLDVSKYIIWLGYRKDIQNLMSQLDLVVLSSLWEGLPLTPIESFSVGTPVVATAVDGTVEIIQDGKNGYLVNPRDSNDLAEKINLAIDSNLTKMGEAAIETFKAEFSFEVFRNRFIAYYKGLK